MGTNYYLYEKDDCACCGRPYEPRHIGKSSMGWRFSLHVDSFDGINSLEDWRALWSAPGSKIRNEYGDLIGSDEMERIITERTHPLGLRWHEIDGSHCVGHGDGPWDYITGEFS